MQHPDLQKHLTQKGKIDRNSPFKLLRQGIDMLSDETRLKILIALSYERHCVTELVREVGASSQSQISQHLMLLRASGFVDYTKTGKYHTYYMTERGRTSMSHVESFLHLITGRKDESKEMPSGGLDASPSNP